MMCPHSEYKMIIWCRSYFDMSVTDIKNQIPNSKLMLMKQLGIAS